MKLFERMKNTYSKLIEMGEHVHENTAADSPAEFSFRDWKKVLLVTKESIGNKKLGILAAGVAYFATLAFFPLMAAGVAIAAFILDSGQIKDAVAVIDQYLPKDMASLVSTQLESALGNDSGNILVGLFAIALSLFSVSGATQNLINATNSAYSTQETRGFIKLRSLSLMMTVISMAIGAVSIGFLLINESFLQQFGVPTFINTILPYARWIILALIVTIGLALFYRYGPDRKDAKWQWVSWGAGIATIIWLLGTTIFFVYAQYFGNFSDTYSLFAGIIVLMTWLNLSSFIILLGAEINHRMERQTTEDTTES